MAYVCRQCDHRSHQWMGFCPRCGSRDPLVDTAEGQRSAPVSVPLSKVGEQTVEFVPTGLAEFDRVLGGGFVPGMTMLLGGEPGVGKSTLVLQAAGRLAAQGGKILIASAEESADQIGLRADRLGISSEEIHVLAEGDVDSVLGCALNMRPDLLVVDSVQTVTAPDQAGTAGSVGQVRECAARLIRFAKDNSVGTVLVGHVTKDGALAGPKLLEHMVDVVLYLEGDTEGGLRSLHSLKNRFGATNLAGIFEMRPSGLEEVTDPSARFMEGRREDAPGSVAFVTVQGRRPVLVEVQALTLSTKLAQPRRSVRGVDGPRLHQLLAVLERHAGLRFGEREVYVNVAGGMRLVEPAADLAVAIALASSLRNRPVGSVAAWGEAGLAGELRTAPQEQLRCAEAERMGLERIVAGGPDLDLRQALESAGVGRGS